MKKLLQFITITCIVLGMSQLATAGDEHPAIDGKDIIPTKMCLMCHGKDKVGNQGEKWKKGPHANAFDSLKTDKAKAIAAKLNIEDPSSAGQCLKCHSTAYGFTEERISTKLSAADGIDCQSCHGAGKPYATKHKKDLKAAYEKHGMLKPTAANTCLRCHGPDGNPTHDPNKPFNYDEMFEKIRHDMTR